MEKFALFYAEPRAVSITCNHRVAALSVANYLHIARGSLVV